MSLLDRLQCAKSALKPTTTTVLLEDGREVEERRHADGSFRRVESISDGAGPSQAGGGGHVSRKREKKVERMRRCGFVVDLKPDTQLAKCCEGLYLGSQDVAADLQQLRSAGITHIVNCATGVRDFFPRQFRYLHLDVLDIPTTQLRGYFPSVHHFIHLAIQNGGKVLVHCNAGISRSSTFVISYLMRFHQLSVHQAMEQVRAVRPVIRPNDGFMQQLLMFDDDLTRERNS